MKKVKINTASGLEALLKLIAEESVSAAMDSSSSEMIRQKSLASDINRSKKGFYLEEDPPSGSPQAPETPPAEEPAAEPPPEPVPDEAESEEQIGSVEPGDIKRALNRLRAGKSVEDSAVEKNLEDFVTSLSTPERKAVFLAINSIAKILASDEIPKAPFKSSKINVTAEEQEGQAPAAGEPAPAPAGEAPAAPAAPEAGTGGLPPIKVGEPPVTEAYRAKIRKIIRGF